MIGSRKTQWSMLWRRWVLPALGIAMAVSLIRSTATDWNYVFSNSMSPCLDAGDCILVNKLAYDLRLPLAGWKLQPWAAPRRGDVVVLCAPDDGERLVKRIVGVPGDAIEIQDDNLLVNGRSVADRSSSSAAITGERRDYGDHRLGYEKLDGKTHRVVFCADRRAHRSIGPITLRAEQYFVLGDNRDQSVDSRSFGVVQRAQIIGRVTAVTLALDPSKRFSPAWDRSFRRIL